jgi:hypothetical protein
MGTEGYKLLDCNRKEILGLPSGAVRLWLTYRMYESEYDESWLSLRALEEITHMDRKTIIKWQKYLFEHGWLVKTGATAAERYSKPTPGSHKVPVVRVDDPTSKVSKEEAAGGGIIPLPEDAGGIFLGGKIPPKVSGYGSASAFDSSSSCHSSSALAINVNRRSGQEKAIPFGDVPPTAVEPEPTPKPKPTPVVQKPKSAPDGTPYPEGFNSWTNPERCLWLEKHKLGKAAPKPKSTPVAHLATPSGRSRLQALTPSPVPLPPPHASAENVQPEPKPQPKPVRKCSGCGLGIGAGCSCDRPVIDMGNGHLYDPKTRMTFQKFVPKSGSDLTAPALQGFEDDDEYV